MNKLTTQSDAAAIVSGVVFIGWTCVAMAVWPLVLLVQLARIKLRIAVPAVIE